MQIIISGCKCITIIIYFVFLSDFMNLSRSRLMDGIDIFDPRVGGGAHEVGGGRWNPQPVRLTETKI